ncbi:hypothetical protein ACIPWB_03155 [[Kitasatospora] papulosa]|uniref:hypothetical protein n=1 Tax=[Kitasatospora] papulosa TaxID=1464011 RepID=UPI00380EA4D8
MTTHAERLIQQLDDSTGPSYDARAELIGIGFHAIPAIIDGLPSLGGFGRSDRHRGLRRGGGLTLRPGSDRSAGQ